MRAHQRRRTLPQSIWVKRRSRISICTTIEQSASTLSFEPKVLSPGCAPTTISIFLRTDRSTARSGAAHDQASWSQSYPGHKTNRRVDSGLAWPDQTFVGQRLRFNQSQDRVAEQECVAPVVPAERSFVQVGRKMLDGELVVRADHRAVEQTPYALGGVRVNIPGLSL